MLVGHMRLRKWVVSLVLLHTGRPTAVPAPLQGAKVDMGASWIHGPSSSECCVRCMWVGGGVEQAAASAGRAWEKKCNGRG